MLKQEFCYAQLDDLLLSMTFYSDEHTTESKATLLYFHGGGLVYGERDDLPNSYCELLVENGYNLLTVDYPLAPECKLAEIDSYLQKAIDWFLANHQTTLGLSNADYFLFGRSAGGYLAYLLSSKYQKTEQKGMISFYGYYDLTDPCFSQPSSYYNQFAKVAPLAAQALIFPKPKATLSINERFSLYLSGRQFGNWLNYLVKTPSEKNTFSLSETDLTSLPPAFLTHSSGDQDVPVEISRKAATLIPAVTYEEISDLPHDFDRDLNNGEGLRIYQLLIGWLDQTTSK
ncbi:MULTISPECIES: alpha/beta hydrolase [unclassified Enterococcus]|uniref:alpha/beta hydrolase n=1 Tax=unclassified Enterococcus TaxID=2608891 RepID=UPI001CE1D4E4|nr:MULTISPECIES: alpha/beta hydrolase [unclassified Enterococcus]MCA5011585.1 alpha/beta hydrolase [Enterococcus sp. S23]MCA5014973.1 alpha/beta hydrolase [Enterococcus sp. S22(2020)]